MKKFCINCGKSKFIKNKPGFECKKCKTLNKYEDLKSLDHHLLIQEAHTNITRAKDIKDNALCFLIIGGIVFIVGVIFLFLSFKYNIVKEKIFRPDSTEFVACVILLTLALVFLIYGFIRLITSIKMKRYFTYLIEEEKNEILKKKIVIFYVSKFKKNTLKVLKFLKEKGEVEIVDISTKKIIDLSKYDYVGFASGIYMEKLDKNIYKFIDNNKEKIHQSFLIYTSGSNLSKYGKDFSKYLKNKGIELLGFLSLPGFVDIGPFKIIKGINKNRPNENDLDRSLEFIDNLKRIK